MKERKKIVRTNTIEKTVKKPYKTPHLIIHGSLDNITLKFPGGSDGHGSKSHS